MAATEITPRKGKLIGKTLTTENVARQISKVIGSDAESQNLELIKLSHKLKVPGQVFNKIVKDNSDEGVQMREIIDYFIEHHPSPSWGRLARAFRELNMKCVAMQLEKFQEPYRHLEVETESSESESEEEVLSLPSLKNRRRNGGVPPLLKAMILIIVVLTVIAIFFYFDPLAIVVG